MRQVTLFPEKPGIDPETLPPNARRLFYALLDELHDQVGGSDSKEDFREGAIELMRKGFIRLVQEPDGIRLELAPAFKAN